jgi:hypothetical protein
MEYLDFRSDTVTRLGPDKNSARDAAAILKDIDA